MYEYKNSRQNLNFFLKENVSAQKNQKNFIQYDVFKALKSYLSSLDFLFDIFLSVLKRDKITIFEINNITVVCEYLDSVWKILFLFKKFKITNILKQLNMKKNQDERIFTKIFIRLPYCKFWGLWVITDVNLWEWL